MNLGHETETLEFKKTTGELKEGVVSIAAILNKHQKGELYFGIKPDGTPIGQQISEKTLRDISQEIANHIEPRIYPEIAVVHIDDKDCIHVSFEGHNTPYFAYNVARIRVADEDKVMSQQELTDYIMERQSSEGVWERKVSECLTSSVDENSLKEYIHRGQEFGRISFDYSDRDTVLGKLSLTAGSYLLNAGMSCSVRHLTMTCKWRYSPERSGSHFWIFSVSMERSSNSLTVPKSIFSKISAGG